MQALLRRLTSAPGSAIVLLLAGIVAFAPGLSSPFMGDDFPQIVDNPPVHSVGNLGQFFSGGTFYFGQGHATLSGSYYRPLMTTTYSLLYTLFGSTPFAFHALQLLLCVGSSIILYHLFNAFFRPALSLCLALVFLLHPANSQIVYGIPSMQDALFVFFGLLGVCLLIRIRSIEILIPVAFCFLLSGLSKETGVLFSAVAVLYLFWFDRRRLLPLTGMMIVPVAFYLALRLHAVGITPAATAPIDRLDMAERLLTVPSVFLFYVAKFLLPVKLASAYYWVNPAFTLGGVVVPAISDLIVVAAVVALGRVLRKRCSIPEVRTYWFFTAWSVAGIGLHLQLIPIDMTATERYLLFPMVGMLGMVGVAVAAFAPSLRRLDRRTAVAVASVLILLLGARTAVRGMDWSDEYTLAQSDLAASPEDYNAEITVANHLAQQGDYGGAREHAEHAVSIYPAVHTYQLLGSILLAMGDYPQAKAAYVSGLTYGYTVSLYEQLGLLTVWYGDPNANHAFLATTLAKLPQDGALWLDLAILDERHNNHAEAKVAVSNAYGLGAGGSQYYYDRITSGAPITVPDHPAYSP